MTFNGFKNSCVQKITVSDKRRAMNISLLLLLGHRIAAQGWHSMTKQVIWTACTTAFFASLRMGEILCDFSNSVLESDFKWKDVKFLPKNELLLRIPFTKTSKREGRFVDIFQFDLKQCCPVAAFSKLKELATAMDSFKEENPVFRFQTGKNLTVASLNNILLVLLADICDPNVSCITSHSFRAAIPSIISAHPDKNFVSDVKEWGYWQGESYLLYTRLRRSQKKTLFNKVQKLLLNTLK